MVDDSKTMRSNVSRAKTKADQLTDDLLGKFPPNKSFTILNDPPPSDIQMKLGKVGKLNNVFIREKPQTIDVRLVPNLGKL